MIPTTPLTEQELYFANLLARCNFPYKQWDGKFAVALVKNTGDLTQRQRWFFYFLLRKYRKQIGYSAIPFSNGFLCMYPICPPKNNTDRADNKSGKLATEKVKSADSQLNLF